MRRLLCKLEGRNGTTGDEREIERGEREREEGRNRLNNLVREKELVNRQVERPNDLLTEREGEKDGEREKVEWGE